MKSATYYPTIIHIASISEDETSYYTFNAHGDVVGLMSSSNELTKSYEYDAFGNEDNPSNEDSNPFRYCGEYYDSETGTYYLRARYYDPRIGRFLSEDTHWNTSNRIYGDNPQKINEREDALGLKTYSYAPQIGAVMQSGNLYVYAVGNPVMYADEDGEMAKLVKALIHGAIDGVIAAMTSDADDTWGYISDIAISFVGGVVGDYLGSYCAFLITSALGLISDLAQGNITLENVNNNIFDTLKEGLINYKVGEYAKSIYGFFLFCDIDVLDELMGSLSYEFAQIVLQFIEDSCNTIYGKELIDDSNR